MVIGNAGGGKSTLCRTVSRVHALPYHAIDQIQWRPNWVPTPEAEYTAQHERLLSKERWLIDGYGSWDSVLRRLDVADTVILVDHPIWIHFWWAAKRQVKSLFVGRPDGPKGCPMFPVTIRLFKMMWWLHREMRPKLLQAIEEAIEERRPRLRLIHIRSPRELRAFAADPV